VGSPSTTSRLEVQRSLQISFAMASAIFNPGVSSWKKMMPVARIRRDLFPERNKHANARQRSMRNASFPKTLSFAIGL
jgi:hypothetical protein